MANSVAARDGTVAFDGGVNSVAVTTIRNEGNPNGLLRNELAWLGNGTMRDGGVTQRNGWVKRGVVQTGDYLFQGKFVYEPTDGTNPYEVWSVSGRILKVDLETYAVTDLSTQFGLVNPATEPYAYFVQADRFLIIQAGDNVTLPLFWDGTTLRRSNGLTGITGGQPTAVYNLTQTGWFTIPAVGATVVVGIDATYPGAPGDQGTYGAVGTFLVTAEGGGPPWTVTLQTVESDFIGHLIGPPGVIVPFTVDPTPTPANVNELPAATAMEYYAGRVWYAIGRVVSAGDIIKGTSGTLAYDFRDSLLKVTENPLAIGGDGFEIPGQGGNIRAIRYGAAIDAALGQGRLFIFTTRAVYGLQVPVSRDDWIAADADNQPLMTVVQLVNGSVNDRSIVAVNGDLYYQSLEPAIRSLDQSVRYFTQPGNRKLSANEQRILQFNDRSLLHYSSGIYFDNRLLETALPRQTTYGVVHDALIPLDFMPISAFTANRTPNWEGHLEGAAMFQMSVVNWGGRERAMAAVLAADNSLELWEISNALKFDFSEDSTLANRVEWFLETPAFNWGNSIGELEFKKLVGAEIWIDRLFGTVIFGVDYRPDGATCWLPWIDWDECSPKNTAETLGLPASYPVNLSECYKATMVLPKPDPTCAPCNNNRPANIGLQFQMRIRVKGWCRIRGVWMWAEPVEKGMYAPSLVC